MVEQNAERRRFTRIPFDAESELHTANATLIVQLADISLHGVLIESQKPLSIAPGETAELRIYLSSDVLIRMPVILTHSKPPGYGFRAGEMDLDSISHLRRLVELNLGDESLLERELDNLVSG
ncbi:PilZ domain-containing protein [Marinobacterium aestuariivivens]|uniref:Cyclic diguanosine monophosphate-binding protein n=1 Tax=Marinobacterium aestuariivivens TaxID=1698799 RepID=A0ABW1ZYF0_9GAMM